MIDGESGITICVKFLWLKEWGSTKIHQELTSTLKDDAYGLSQIKSGCRGSESGIFHALNFVVRDAHPSIWDRRLRRFSKKSFRKCLHNREALPADCFHCQRDSSERIGDEKILAALDPSFLERCSKGYTCFSSKRNARDFTGVRNE
jgi:hypothetical protein